jgi:hypothetical protein
MSAVDLQRSGVLMKGCSASGLQLAKLGSELRQHFAYAVELTGT